MRNGTMHAAVFVDFENLFSSLKKRSDGVGVRTRDTSLQILEGLLAKLRDEGTPMIMGRSYAAFDTYPGVEVAHDLALMGVDPQYVLASHSGRNSADIQLALDVARVLFRRADIDLIVIVSGDRDFIPLARQVLEENRELRIVSIPDATSGDLRERVGAHRFWNALQLLDTRRELLDDRAHGTGAGGAREGNGATAALGGPDGRRRPEGAGGRAADDALTAGAGAHASGAGGMSGIGPGTNTHGPGAASVIVGHIPVTWKSSRTVSAEEIEERVQQCLELLIRAQIRHNSPDIWLSPFLKGPMSQHFSHLVHPERRALINELRQRGVIRVEERDNMYADHPYSVIIVDDQHPMAQAARARIGRGAKPASA